MLNKADRGTVISALIIAASLVCSGCATLRHPVPKDLIANATDSGMLEIRTIIGMPNPVLQESLIKSILTESSKNFTVSPDGTRVYPILAISGGGANGAYGAGLLKGWSAQGTRPVFKAVTGVSTGAIIAPLVFLGKEYDDEIEKLYTTISTKDIMKMKGPIRALFGDSLASNRPLEKRLEELIDEDFLEKTAKEHRNGRRLFVGTTYLDARRFVVWDMGAIACRGDVKLFRKIILASTAIPLIFPPVYIRVEADGKVYDEMHVDGGTITQTFTLYKVLDNAQKVAEEHGINFKDYGIDPSKIKSKYYIIRNGYMTPGYKEVNSDLASIANQSLDTMIDNLGIGDTYRIYAYMQNRGNDYNLAFIPEDLRPVQKEQFDMHLMKELFNRGYQDAVNGYKWHKAPPGMESENF